MKSKLYNDMKTRDDLLKWAIQLLPDPFKYQESSGASYQKEIRELEYCSRPLWLIFSLIASEEKRSQQIISYIQRIKEGLHKGSPYQFPTPTTNTRQIAVEMAVYGYGLLSCQEKFLNYLTKQEVKALEEWLVTINDIDFPVGNWLFFLLIVNCGLKVNHLSYSQDKIDYAIKEINKMYIGNGWYQDGHPSQRDYYISFAFHFYSLILRKYCPECGLEDIEKRSLYFENDFTYWMDQQGRTLPYGRSLTYRFAHNCYWGASVVSGVHNLELGEIKTMIFKNFNFWKKQNIKQNQVLSIGYGYSNLLLSEDYNAFGSPMWAMKAFVILALPENHYFWKTVPKKRSRLNKIYKEQEPGFLIVTGEKHHYALSASQYSRNEILQHFSKYGKLCYSTAFGWNLSRDIKGIKNFAVDNALALSVKGTKQFTSRGKIDDSRVYQDYIYSCWSYEEIARIESWLIPVDEQCHVRIHRIHTNLELETYEGAFPIWKWNPKFDYYEQEERCIKIMKDNQQSLIIDLFDNRVGEIVVQNPNTNIYSCERNAVATLHGLIKRGMSVIGSVIYGSIDEDVNIKDIQINGNCVSIEYKEIILKEF